MTDLFYFYRVSSIFNNLIFNNLMSIWSTNKMMCQFDYFIIELLHYLVIELLDY